MGLLKALQAQFALWMYRINAVDARYWHQRAEEADALDDTRGSTDAREMAYDAERAAEQWRLTAERHEERSAS